MNSETDLGEHPFIWNPIETNGKMEGGSVTSIKKVADTINFFYLCIGK
ncbi:hypothetical protein [Solibacillus sp. FSL H8-0538]